MTMGDGGDPPNISWGQTHMRGLPIHLPVTWRPLNVGPFCNVPTSLGQIRGRFRKRVVLVNVPSSRFSFRGNMRTYPRSGFPREMEVQRQSGTTSPDPEKIPEPLRGPLGGFLVGIPREEKPLRASKGQLSSERLSEAFPLLVLHLRSSSRFSFRGNIRMHPRSGFRSGGDICQNHPFGKPPLATHVPRQHRAAQNIGEARQQNEIVPQKGLQNCRSGSIEPLASIPPFQVPLLKLPYQSKSDPIVQSFTLKRPCSPVASYGQQPILQLASWRADAPRLPEGPKSPKNQNRSKMGQK